MLTQYAGELVQHDTSHHIWAPLTNERWPLITSIDDYSRCLLYGDLWSQESSFAHISAVEYVATRHGCPHRYYVDNHAIFRYIERRDTVWRKAQQTEEAAAVQWKAVLADLGIEVIYALSPQAKGKIERPYRWLQDHLVRICAREGITRITEAREVLYREINTYNYKRIHSTTGEVPMIRLERSLKENRGLFHSLHIKKPFQKPEDIFCLRDARTVNPYRKISLYAMELSVSAPPRSQVELRIRPHTANGLSLVRCWFQDRLVGEYHIKTADLKINALY